MALCNNSCSSNLCGFNSECAVQVAGSEIMVQPAPFHVVLPGPMIAASSEPPAVLQYNPCASGYGGYYPAGYGTGYGCGYGLGYGRRYHQGSSYPCSYPGYSRRCSFSNCGPC